jgi:hypothetical protein
VFRGVSKPPCDNPDWIAICHQSHRLWQRHSTQRQSLQLQPTPKDPCADRDSLLTGTWVKS